MTAAVTDDIALIERSGQAVLITVARDCRQPGCRDSAGWILKGGQPVALCTEHAARRIRRRALPSRCAR